MVPSREPGGEAGPFMEPAAIAQTPQPPYYAVIFTSVRTGVDGGYAETAALMNALAARQPGYLGVESAHSPGGLGITVSYWASEEAIAAWKANVDHQVAQSRGRADWYSDYQVRVARVERAHGRPKGAAPKGSQAPRG